MYEAFKGLTVHDLSSEILKVATPGAKCVRRIVTQAMSIAVVPGKSEGVYVHVVIGDTAGEEEFESLKDLEEEMGFKMEEGAVVFHECFMRPHPHMQGSEEFVQFEVYRGENV
ncbi:hypothetical protein [Streptomyces sp. NPDC050485]|uniref:hypothetical protein n=1 Tax=Streptomyces sp. NPDC050485 TaxID=3365617 RepID=UPI003788744B